MGIGRGLLNQGGKAYHATALRQKIPLTMASRKGDRKMPPSCSAGATCWAVVRGRHSGAMALRRQVIAWATLSRSCIVKSCGASKAWRRGMRQLQLRPEAKASQPQGRASR